ncbi:hypothetical protein [Nocardioides marmotae]|uniref:Uncharacterized protein n=1 Tax=Nocardioides marmotae TaxID=2663857 RepID=A0A6I3J1H0_9ACTN|nr:hypothetical protein [Nocardioides marmotae]MCR6030520.1 hypothetical protein [Gordonia jinghuaiqii]MBC9734651.1 hypothetical protein [Nocardioides marmotae]MTB85753.1 hypothetical protein [Nocardioides marmotae]MTB94156.1 hypothetical protein [Nocardioides marmotae]QKE00451.1 hypothetical protein HPC71_04665 [Nocardioides marmotae]
MALHLLPLLADTVVRAAQQAPEPEDVKAGWLAFGIFIGLAVAVGLLGWSLVHRIRNVQAAEDAGRYDPSDRRPRSEEALPFTDEVPRPAADAPEQPRPSGPSAD